MNARRAQPDRNAPGEPAPGRGRVLRLKRGYNPNSSSVGTELPAFLALAVGAGALTLGLLHAIEEAARFMRARRARLTRAGSAGPCQGSRS